MNKIRSRKFHKTGKSFIQPKIIPPFHCDKISKPLKINPYDSMSFQIVKIITIKNQVFFLNCSLQCYSFNQYHRSTTGAPQEHHSAWRICSPLASWSCLALARFTVIKIISDSCKKNKCNDWVTSFKIPDERFHGIWLRQLSVYCLLRIHLVWRVDSSLCRLWVPNSPLRHEWNLE